MHLLNFAHPITDEQRQKAETLLEMKIDTVHNIKVQVETSRPLAPQVLSMVDSIDLSPEQWQGEKLVINPPSLNYITAVLLAELHGRMGYFPPCVRLRPVPGATPPRFEVAEILNLQHLRENARKKR